ncbi:cyclin-like protein interacting with PHO85 [Coemansia sp. RSA 2523]|nr:cyclin-like protein interacting with PHO85 [Coemansia sp. RSA 2523]KAJ2139983.1 cyclin-like protein interacting with PHO85 [Coemansia sp. RSA 788]KAJ2168850.1 cyclin-like protein interacting with PHO85 [Coemansia sp. RSA 562]KAJ2173520.1 cyclin-like protein interacting with PHO85 [Coemansia sp. RSA 560]KAJ2182712.1 cyclin-like protein interacting with PHO85 [Coemansia sp. RSA 551]KAJ2191620.1 cyclin-like protein interacting with PHO85 [Coemansia sp. RSA 532]KAJ2194827.1 cyclin-like protein
MFDISHTPVSVTIAHMAELIDSVAEANHQVLGPIINDVTQFHSRAIPTISVHDYLERVAKFVCLENDSLLAVLVYIDRITRAQIHRPALAPSPFNIHRMALAAIVVAHKFNSDIFFNNARYSKVGGILLVEMNQLELELLFLAKFDLKVDVTELQQLGEWLVTRSRAVVPCQPPFCLLTQYYEDTAHHIQFPTPLLDPSSGTAHGLVPHLDLAPYTLRPEPQHNSYDSKSLRHTIHVTQPRFHVPPHKQSAQASTVELTTPSSLNTAYQPSTPLALGDVDRTSTTDLLLTASPTHPAVDSTLVPKRRRLHSSAIYSSHDHLSRASINRVADPDYV